MIMPRGSQLLLPANPWFIAFSLIVALVIDMIPLGRLAWMPDALAVVLVFWGVHQPRRVGVLWAFVFGLAMDVHDGALLGQHALAYSALSFGAVMLHRRLPWFSLGNQAVQVLPLFVAAHLIALVVRMVVGGMWPGWGLLLAPLLEAALWPLASLLLLAPQRRAPDPDAHRPL
ncbi:MAG: rod shape-determining protein MreD [Roseateles depolymerans]|uniref:Rod shape-determining protein MreD n=1 Tax=Roseateles depolymerans TaxID=76731 RepID=A0A2W5FI72_9BURK|nr:MAG: rod shape-determining protein MreD [Roseateles depolymerans]